MTFSNIPRSKATREPYPTEHFGRDRAPSLRSECKSKNLPAASLQHCFLFNGSNRQAFHRARHLLADFEQHFRIVEVGCGFDDGAGAGLGACALIRTVKIEWRGAVFHEDAG